MGAKRGDSGFTLIELVVVIVILGILAATALPKFIDMSSDAGNAAAQGVAGAISSGSSINYAKYQVSSAAAQTITGANAAVCTTGANTAGALVSGVTMQTTAATTNSAYQISAGSGTCSGAGSTVTCTITGYKGTGQTATVVCTN